MENIHVTDVVIVVAILTMLMILAFLTTINDYDS